MIQCFPLENCTTTVSKLSKIHISSIVSSFLWILKRLLPYQNARDFSALNVKSTFPRLNIGMTSLTSEYNDICPVHIYNGATS